MMYKSMAVFCGSKTGNDILYEEHAKQLGKILAQKNIQLVYGGGNIGLMGIIADSVMQNGGKVIGVIPKLLVEWERQHTGITELKIVEDMPERKKLMYDLCNAAIILPGGNGTLDELFEIITLNTLGIYEKKIFILNSNGYYNYLIEHLKNMQAHGFLNEDWQQYISICNEPEAIFALC